jgi:hypothetical protein
LPPKLPPSCLGLGGNRRDEGRRSIEKSLIKRHFSTQAKPTWDPHSAFADRCVTTPPRGLGAFSGEVAAGSPLQNAITQGEIERIPIPLIRNSLKHRGVTPRDRCAWIMSAAGAGCNDKRQTLRHAGVPACRPRLASPGIDPSSLALPSARAECMAASRACGLPPSAAPFGLGCTFRS